MPRILITGNGFDLHHNLPTWYEDFMNVIQHVSRNYDVDFDSVYRNTRNYESIKATFKNKLSIEQQTIDDIKEIANKNLLYQYFQKEYDIDTWIDFESKLEYLLVGVSDGIKMLRKNIFNISPLQNNAQLSIKRLLEGKVEYAIIMEILKVIETDFESFYIDEKFLVVKENFNINIDEEKILALVFSQLMEFKKLFHIYIQTFVIPLLDDKEQVSSKIDFYRFFNYHFTFNYTPTAKKIYGEKTKMFYLHGKSEVNDENIVFGINELFSIENTNSNYLRFTKYYQKYAYKTDFHFLNDIEQNSFSYYQFYFWGHSLDQSDSYYINEIFDFLSEKNNIKNKKIIVIYHNDESYKRLLKNLFFIRGRQDIEKRMQNRTLVFYTLDASELQEELRRKLTQSITF